MGENWGEGQEGRYPKLKDRGVEQNKVLIIQEEMVGDLLLDNGWTP